MKRTHLVVWSLGLAAMLYGPAPDVWAGFGFAEGDPPCLVKKQDFDPPNPRVTGTMAVDIRTFSPGEADVIFRTERRNDLRFFRMVYQTTAFGQPDLKQYQNRVCEILNTPSASLGGATLASQIIAAYNLQGTRFVITPRSIRHTQVVPDENGDTGGNEPISSGDDLLVPGSAPPRAMTILDLVIYAQP